MIEARGLTKRFGDKLAVDQLSFTVEPGRQGKSVSAEPAGASADALIRVHPENDLRLLPEM